ncbi:AI-2E family transporter [Liquorilactobacillus aquaticus]|uniref:AI-2E family transporter n=1 Tax=Liquorilactobacillus aquaticus TaxID=392566 RepID=UPI000710034D|nr:AI-2E family transporter [Liquorilactobacillus aquaticus]
MRLEKSRWIRFLGGNNLVFTLVTLGLVATLIFLFDKISFIFKPLGIIAGTVLPPLIFGVVIYYLLNPLVKLLEKRLSRTWVISVIYVLILILLAAGGIQLLILVQDQAVELFNKFPDIVKGFQDNFDSATRNLPFANEINQLVKSVDLNSDKIGDFVSNYFTDGLKGFGGVFSAVTTTFLTILTGPIVAFFLLKDKEKFYNFVKKIVPPVFRNDFNELFKIVDQQIGGYLKGQIVASIILGILYWPAFLLIGLNYAGAISLAAGILCIIPYIGPFAVFIPGLIVAFQTSFMMAVKFVVVWFVIQFLHGELVVPRVMGDKVQLHPITVLLVLLVMGDLMGLVGVIFGIPIYCLVKVFAIYLFRIFKRRYNRFYGNHGKYEDTKFSKDDYLD